MGGSDSLLGVILLLMEEPVDSLYIDVYTIIYHGFIHPRWCRVSSINNRIPIGLP